MLLSSFVKKGMYCWW